MTLVEYAPDQIALEVLARRAKQAGAAQAAKVNEFARQNPAIAAEWLTRGAAGTTERREINRPRKNLE